MPKKPTGSTKLKEAARRERKRRQRHRGCGDHGESSGDHGESPTSPFSGEQNTHHSGDQYYALNSDGPFGNKQISGEPKGNTQNSGEPKGNKQNSGEPKGNNQNSGEPKGNKQNSGEPNGNNHQNSVEQNFSDQISVDLKSCEPNDNVHCIQGNFHQGYINYFQENSGKQCVANSLCCMLYRELNVLEKWNESDIDKILFQGNELYGYIQKSSTMKDDYLLVTELPEQLISFNHMFKINVHEPVVGLFQDSQENSLNEWKAMSFENALDQSFAKSTSCFVCFSGNTIGVFKDSENKFYIFDPHSRNTQGLVSPHGKSVLLMFPNKNELVHHCNKLAHSLDSKSLIQFEISPVSVCMLDKLQKSALSIKSTEVKSTNDLTCKEDVIITGSEGPTKYAFLPLSNEKKIELCRKVGLHSRTKCTDQECNSNQTLNSQIIMGAPKSKRKIKPDGNCFFRSISWIISNTESNHIAIRNSVCNYMVKNPKTVRQLIPSQYKSVENYIDGTKMKAVGTWATTVEIMATSCLLETDVYTFTSNDWLIFSYNNNKQTKSQSIYLDHKDSCHYDVVTETHAGSNFSHRVLSEKAPQTDDYERDTIQDHIRIKNYLADQAMKRRKHYDVPIENEYTSRKVYMKNCMKTAREKNPQKYRVIDLKSKSKAREKNPQKYKKIDAVSKSKSKEHDPISYQGNNKQIKTKARQMNPQKYKKIDFESKSKAREKNPQKYKKIDAVSKSKSKEHDPISYRGNNKQIKTKARQMNPQKYKKIDFESKSKAREMNPQKYKKIDFESKSKAREMNPQKYKKIDLTSKLKARKTDHQFLKKETDNDVKRKQAKRKDGLFAECERIAKQRKRKENRSIERQIDKDRKTQKRKSSMFTEVENIHRKKKKYGSGISECIDIFKAKISTGPVYVCSCCQQTWFKESVHEFKPMPSYSEYKNYLSGYKSFDGKEYLCGTCSSSLKQHKTPRLSLKNKMSWPVKPKELDLHPLEERLVALRIPFMQIRELPSGGQYSTKGNVVNVPVNIQPTVDALPRPMDENFTIAVKLKKKLVYRKCDYSENVRPAFVLMALHWLMKNSELYKNSGLKIDENWMNKITTNAEEVVKAFTDTIEQNPNEICEENNQDNYCEVHDDDRIQGNSDTLVEDANLNSNQALVFAPGEGKKPLSLYDDKDAEFLSFPSIYCGQRRPENKERDVAVHYSDIAKWQLRSNDRRAAKSVPLIFMMLKKIQNKQVSDKVNLAVRRCKTDGKKLTAGEACSDEQTANMVNHNEGYYIFKTLRNSPAYLEAKKKDIFAMIRQLDVPTWFMSLSAADTRWVETLKSLARLNGETLSDEDVEKMDWNTKSKLIKDDPVTCSRIFDHRAQLFINTVLKSDHHPIGKVTDTFQRVEFQNRGSPHIHMMLWTEDGPKYKLQSENDIIQYVDKYITCSLDIEDESLKSLVQLQVHKHTKTCKKQGKPVCRFGFPLPPLPKTMILEPLEVDVDKYKKKYLELHSKLNDFKDGCDLSYETFLDTVVEMNESEYIKCIRSSLRGPKIFLKRKPSEMRVNYYSESVLTAWKANIDIQFVLDPYACAMYIVSYISKSQRGMSSMLENAAREASEGNMDLKRQVRHIGNKFLNFVEVSAQEACYLVLQMPLTRSSRNVEFINTSEKNQRVYLLKDKETLKNLPKDSTDIESDNKIKQYSKRPRNLEHWCLADYVSELEIKYPKNDDSKKNNDINDDDVHSDEANDEENDIFTDKHIVAKLGNGIVIKRRKTAKVIRYVRFNQKTNSENYYREKILLFLPWRSETTDMLKGYATHEEHYMSRQKEIEEKINKYEYNTEELDRARTRAETEEDDFDDIAPSTEQKEAEDAEEPVTNSDEYVHFFPETQTQAQYDIGPDIGLSPVPSTVETSTERIPDDDYFDLVRSLNLKQREFFNHVIHWIKTKKDEPIRAFLSGGAGVGKSVVIRALYQALHRLLNSNAGDDPNDIKILLCAFTGKAAYNINGRTIASAFRSKMFQKDQHMSSSEVNTFRTTYKNLSIIIIDEISMVGNKLFTFIHERLALLTGTNEDFGNLHIIAVGDLYQLPPVAERWIFDELKIALATNLWKKHFTLFELTEIMRQKNDLEFAKMLNRLRHNKLTENDRSVIESHTISPNSPDYPKQAQHLFTQNKYVNEFNKTMIESLDTTKVVVKADTDVTHPSKLTKESKSKLISQINNVENHSITANLPSAITIAVNMTYDICINVDVLDGLTNGATCVVQYIEFDQTKSITRPKIIWVLFTDRKIGSKRRTQYSSYYVDKKLNRTWTPIFEATRSFVYNRKTYERIQFPLLPSAAKTVHKAQGSTVDSLVVDLKSYRSNPGIHYVALSRVRTLANLHILDFNAKALVVDEAVDKEMERLRQSPLKLCFKPLYAVRKENITLLFNNARSYHKHYFDVRNDPSIFNADILGFSESRLTSNDQDTEYTIKGFKIYRNDVNQTGINRPFHGLVLYLKDAITVQKMIMKSQPQFEFIYSLVKVKSMNLQVVYLYRSSKCGLPEFRTCIEDQLLPIIDIDCPFVILGDFNLDLLIDGASQQFKTIMQNQFCCTQLISEPTTDRDTLIDHLYSNITGLTSGTIPAYWSDHYIIYGVLETD